MEPTLEVQGILGEKIIREKKVGKIKNIKMTFRGCRIDTLKLTAKIESREEVKDLIDFLNDVMFCFDN